MVGVLLLEERGSDLKSPTLVDDLSRIWCSTKLPRIIRLPLEEQGEASAGRHGSHPLTFFLFEADVKGVY